MPVRFSLRLTGPGADPEGRRFVVAHSDVTVGKLFPPDLFILTPARELLGRLRYDASADRTLEFLREALALRPDLAPGTDPLDRLHYDLTDRAQAALAHLERRWATGERMALIQPLEDWLDNFSSDWQHGAATARVMLGAARYHAADFAGADAVWREVLERHPNHPLRHRAEHNLIDAVAWRMPPHPDLEGARHPMLGERPVVHPQPAVRLKNLQSIASSVRYRKTRSGLPLVQIPAGTFTMGGQPAMFARELPLRRVTISRPFLIAAYAITTGLWRRFRPDDVPEPTDPAVLDLPVQRVTREDALQFCEYLSSVDGLSYTLPTEAEWEYAARGGVEGADFPWGDQTPDETMCNYLHATGVPVASYAPNGYGLFDVVGNGMEWVADKFLDNAFALTPAEVVDPEGPTEADGWTWVVGGGYVVRSGYLGIPFCAFLARNAHRWTTDKAGFRPAVRPGNVP